MASCPSSAIPLTSARPPFRSYPILNEEKMFGSVRFWSESLATTPGRSQKRGAVDQVSPKKIARLAHRVVTGDHHDSLLERLGGQP